jgi:hypothetical protein
MAIAWNVKTQNKLLKVSVECKTRV